MLGRVAGTTRAGEVFTLITSGEYGDSMHISRSDCERDVVTEVEGTCRALDSSLPSMKLKMTAIQRPFCDRVKIKSCRDALTDMLEKDRWAFHGEIVRMKF